MFLHINLKFLFLCLVFHLYSVLCVTPDETLNVLSNEFVGSTHCASASFGNRVHYYNAKETHSLILPARGIDACDTESTIVSNYSIAGPFILLAARGNCSFDRKATIAQTIGASGIIIYNNMQSIYQSHSSLQEIDYDCSNGQGWVDEIHEPAWDHYNNDVSCSENPKCKSKQCGITGVISDSKHQICCVWDVYLRMGATGDVDAKAITIPSSFIRMQDFADLSLNGNIMLKSGLLMVQVSKRPIIELDAASYCVVAIATTTLLIAVCLSVSDWRAVANNKSSSEFQNELVVGRGWKTSCNRQDDDDNGSFKTNRFGRTYGSVVSKSDAKSPVELESLVGHDSSLYHTDDADQTRSSFIIKPNHIVQFFLASGCVLFVLYFFPVYELIVAIYIIVASACFCHLFLMPMVRLLVVQSTLGRQLCDSGVLKSFSFGDLILSSLSSAVALLYFFSRFVSVSVDSHVWILQDFMNACMCIEFLRIIQVSNLKVASILLCLGFVYDVLFVIVSRFIFGESLMISVATESNTANSEASVKVLAQDPNYCEKYPNDSDVCSSVYTALPMIMVYPKIYDYTGGYSMLGLGDIVVPGILIVLAAKIDSEQSGNFPSILQRYRYTALTVYGYVSGLLLANIVVARTGQGQPALLYLVPLTLLPLMMLMAWRKELRGHWQNELQAGESVDSRRVKQVIEMNPVETNHHHHQTHAPQDANDQQDGNGNEDSKSYQDLNQDEFFI